MTTPPEPFSLGLTYWPRRAGFQLWRQYDRGASREELAHIAALGCDTVRLCLLWEDFQPSPERISTAAMRLLEHALDSAHAAGLRAALALFPVAVGGALLVPHWANGPDVRAALRRAGRDRALTLRAPTATPVLTEAGYRPAQTGDLFGEATAREAQRLMVRELVGAFGAHPAAWAWQLGEGIERVHPPASHETTRAWIGALADEARRARTGVRLIGVASAYGMGRAAGPRPEDLAATCGMLGVAADPHELPADGQRRHTAGAAFLHALAAGLAGQRAIVTSVGMPGGLPHLSGWADDQAYGKPLRAFFATAEQQGSFVDAALERLHKDGAAGVWLAAYADAPEDAWRLPPLDRSLRSRALGVVDAAGREKPAAEALRAFAARIRQSETPQPNPAPPTVDAERYWHDPRGQLRALWREFNAEP